MTDVDIDLLIVECLERVEIDGPDALATYCERYPQLADQLRTAITRLLGHGVIVHGESRDDDDSAVPDVRRRVGQRIGDYVIGREIGRGGMGVVFEATDVRLGRRVALKVSRLPIDDDEMRRRFHREAEITASLDHRGLVRVHAAGIDADHPWLALEFIEGERLDERMASWESEGTPDDKSLRERVEILAQIAEALGHMHARGLVHRDVKPSNIFLRPDGSVAVGDFGLSRHEEDLGLTQSGAFAGTVHYASPEQTSGIAARLAPQSDVFSLGVLMYECLTLQRPFEAPTQRAILEAIEKHEPKDPARMGVPTGLAAIALKALEKDPARRYTNGRDFADDLRAHLEHRPIRARRASGFERTRRWILREPLKAALVAVVLVASLIVSGLVGYGLSQRPLVEEARLQQRIADAQAATLGGWVHMSITNDAEGAKRHFLRAMELAPSTSAVLGLALSVKLLDGSDAAIAVLRDGTTELPASRSLRRMLARELIAVADDEESTASEGQTLLEQLGPPIEAHEYFLLSTDSVFNADLREDGGALLARGKAYLDAALRASKQPHPELYWMLANYYYAEVGGDEAAGFARATLELWPDTAFSAAVAGLALRRHAPDRSIGHLESAIERDELYAPLRSEVAAIQLTKGQVAEARTTIDRILELDPGHLAGMRMHALLEEREGRVDAALDILDRAIELADQNGFEVVRTFLQIIDVCKRNDRQDYGLERLPLYIQRVRDVPALRTSYASFAHEFGRSAAAKATLDDWIETFGPSVSVLNARAMLARRRGAPTEALADLEHALRLEPHAPVEIKHNLSVLYSHSGDHEKAIRLATEVVEETRYREPRHILMLAINEERAGKIQDAWHHARMAIDLLRAIGEQPDRDVWMSLKRLERRLRTRVK